MVDSQRKKSPRAFSDAVSLDAWRTGFDSTTAEATLHVDVIFDRARVGNNIEAPVRFRLSLKRAEIRVILDAGEILSVPPLSVARSNSHEPIITTVSETERSAKAGAVLDLSAQSPNTGVKIGGGGSKHITEIVEDSGPAHEMRFQHRRTEDGYAFIVEPLRGQWLRGSPWPATEPRLSIRDTKQDRERGDPPEVRVQLHCLREDLNIQDIKITGETEFYFSLLSRNKQVAVEQYIKDELAKLGLECGELSDAFARLVLADVTSQSI